MSIPREPYTDTLRVLLFKNTQLKKFPLSSTAIIVSLFVKGNRKTRVHHLISS